MAALLLLGPGCSPATARPYFPPVTGAPRVLIDLDARPALTALVDVLRQDSLPVRRVELRDGFVETEWFDSGTRKPRAPRTPGPAVVRVRAWVDPLEPGRSRITMETVYRPLADPSRSDRDLDRQVPPDHPVGQRMKQVIEELARLHAREPDLREQAPGTGPPGKP